jgi:hypothetical protein
MKEDRNILLEISRIKTMMGIFMESENNGILLESNPLSRKVITPAIEWICKRFGLTAGEITSEGFLSELESQILQKRLSGVEDELSDLSKAIKRGATEQEVNRIVDSFLSKPVNYTVVLQGLKSTHPQRFFAIVGDTIKKMLSHPIYNGVEESLSAIYKKKGTEGVIDALNALKKEGKLLITDTNEILWKNWHPGVVKPIKTPKTLVSIIKNYIDGISKTAIGGNQTAGSGDQAITYLRMIKRSFTPITQLRKEFVAVSEEATRKLLANPPEKWDYEAKKMADIMAAMNKKGGDKIDYQTLWKGHNGKGGLFTIVPKELQEQIETNGAWKQAYDLMVRYTNNLSEDGSKIISRGFTYNLTTLDARAMRELIFLGAQKGVINKSKAFFQRSTNIIVSVNPLSWKESLEALMHRGTDMNTVFMTVGRGIVHSFIMPGFAAFLVTNLEAAASGAEYANLKLKETIKGWGVNVDWWKEFNFVDYNEGGKSIFIDDLWERYKSYIPENWYNAFLDVTYMDEVVRKMFDFYDNRGKDEEIIRITEDQSCENLMKTISEDTTGVFEKIGCDKNKDCAFNRLKLEESTKKNKDEVTPTPSPDGGTPGSYDSFKQFCSSQNPPLTPDADTGNVGIYTVGGVEYEWDGTTFKILR